MGNVAGYRQAFADAQDYRRQWEKYDRELAEYQKKNSKEGAGSDSGDKKATPPSPPKRDLKLETLADVLKGDIRVQMHCYRGDQMATETVSPFESVSRSWRFTTRSRLTRSPTCSRAKGVCAAVGRLVGLQGRGIRRHPENIAIVDAPGRQLRDVAFGFRMTRPAPEQEAAKAMSRGVAPVWTFRRAGDPLADGQPCEGARPR
jgi:hypothetical protein